jgi:GNAT superfamily N-acetyltransferase
MKKVEIIDANADNVCDFGFCGFKDPKQEGYRRKTAWLRKRFTEGMRYKILHAPDEGAVGFIEYAPGEKTWRPIEAPGYLVIHCMMIHRKKYKGKGYGSLLLDACLQDAKRVKSNGVAVVASGGTWMATTDLFLKSGFECVDTAPPSYELLAKKLRRARSPKFREGWEQRLRRYGQGLTIIRSDQCPCVAKSSDDIQQAAKQLGVQAKFVELKNSRQAQNAPSAYGVFNVVYNGELIADHPISARRFNNIMTRLSR